MFSNRNESLDKLEILRNAFQRKIRRAYGWGGRKAVTIIKHQGYRSKTVQMVLRDSEGIAWGVIYGDKGVHIYKECGVHSVDLMEGFAEQQADPNALDYDPYRGVLNEYSYREAKAMAFAKENFTDKQYHAYMAFMNTFILGEILGLERLAYDPSTESKARVAAFKH